MSMMTSTDPENNHDHDDHNHDHDRNNNIDNITTPFNPALIVVDMQEDFCPPNGSLAVPSARSIVPTITHLLSLPGFTLKIATQDYHPPNHISFASNHPPPNNQPFVSFIDMKNPVPPPPSSSSSTSVSATGNRVGDDNDDDAGCRRYEASKPQRLWPVHCVQNTPGASLIPELLDPLLSTGSTGVIDHVVRKGQDPDVEMYSAFADAFGNNSFAGNNSGGDGGRGGGVSLDLARTLRERRITDVFVVGLAGDYCVKCTAIDARKEGFRTWVVREGVRSVDEKDGWEEARREMEKVGVGIVGVEGAEVARVKAVKALD